MLEQIAVKTVKEIAELAKAARSARDRMLDKVPDEALGQPTPARGAHNPAAGLGLDPLPSDHAARTALREAITSLSPAARRELRVLMWIGRGEYAKDDWRKALSVAATATDDVTLGALMDQADLHDCLIKGLYELKLL